MNALTPPPLAQEIASDLTAWSGALGIADPTRWLLQMLEESFDLQLDDGAYRKNELSPGKIPFEISFSEATPSRLRMDLEPWPNKMSPEARRAKLTEEVVRLVGQVFGGEASRRFADAAAPWLAATHPLRFGAFFGASFDRDGPADLRIYFERALEPDSTSLGRIIAGTVPILESVTLSRSGSVSARTYLCFSAGLHLPDLEAFMRELRLEHRFEELFAAVRDLHGGSALGPAQAIAGVRALSSGSELKLDFRVAPRRAAEAEEALGLHLSHRQDAASAYRRWRDAIGAARLSVLSVRVAADSGASVNVYAHPYLAAPAT